MADYRLALELRGHTAEVYDICVCRDAGIATSSGDNTLNFWKRDSDNENGYVLSKTLPGNLDFGGNLSFGGPLAWMLPSERFPEGVIVSAGTTISLCDLKSGQVVETMTGHNSQVTGLLVETNGEIISSSMDCTVTHWRNGTILNVLKAQKVVQALLKLPTGEMLTGSSDFTIEVWKESTFIKALSGHAVRLLCGEKVIVDGNLGGETGSAIPSEADLITDIEATGDIKCVIVMEKDTAFHHLLGEGYHEDENCVLITAKGQPDVATRIILRKLKNKFPEVPFYAMVDYNPSGLGIFWTYCFGSDERAHCWSVSNLGP